MSYHYLMHHGILGMKWGIRRFQNEDGSLTAAGRKRYLNDDGSYNDRAKTEIPDIVAKSLGDSELSREINRMRAENDYKKLLADRYGVKQESRISSMIKKSLLSFGEQSFDKAVNLAVDSIFSKIASSEKKKDSLVDFTKDELLHPEKLSFSRMKQLTEAIKNARTIKDYGSRSR